MTFLILISSAYSYNESYTDLKLVNSGWCPTMEIEFQVFNKTDYENKDAIEDDEDLYFHNISDAEIIIYDGPIKSRPILFEDKTNKTGHFKFTFDEPNQYLIEIKPKGKYNPYSELFEIMECKWMNEKVTKDEENETKKTNLYNKTFEYETSKTTIELKDTDMNSSENITIELIDDIISQNLPELNNSVKTIKITTNSQNYTSLKISTIIEPKQDVEIITFSYDENQNQWTEVNYVKEREDLIIFENVKPGIYSIVEKEIIKEENKTKETPTQNNNENQNQQPANPINDPFANQSSNSNSQLIKLATIIIPTGLLLFVGFKFMQKTKDKKNNNNNNNNQHNKSMNHKTHEEPQVLNTYNQVYQKTKEYVRSYKTSYGKDQIYRALKNAGVPNDVIDKVFIEEF